MWEVILLLRRYDGNVTAVAKHLRWAEGKVRAAVNYAEAFPEEIGVAMAENDSADLVTLKRMLPQAVAFTSRKTKRV
jgi:hypothetical protein